MSRFRGGSPDLVLLGQKGMNNLNFLSKPTPLIDLLFAQTVVSSKLYLIVGRMQIEITVYFNVLYHFTES